MTLLFAIGIGAVIALVAYWVQRARPTSQTIKRYGLLTIARAVLFHQTNYPDNIEDAELKKIKTFRNRFRIYASILGALLIFFLSMLWIPR